MSQQPTADADQPLPQATAGESQRRTELMILSELLHVYAATCPPTASKDPAESRLQSLICAVIPIYNSIASPEGWPVFPLPAFCVPPTAPTPTPAE